MAGNANSGRREKPFAEALRMEALSAERGDPCDALPGSLRWNARQLLSKGDVASIREMADRLDGKVPQAITGGDEGDSPVTVVHRIELVAPKT